MSSRHVAVGLLAVVLLGCGSPGSGEGTGTTSRSPSADQTPSVVEQPESDASSSVVEQPESDASSSVVEQPEERGRSVETTRQRLRGIDVSHHQGVIDWQAVAGDGIDFAYLKATEGSGFTDDRFVGNAREARAAGLRVGGYHYYTLCAPPEPQADHFVATLAQVRTTLPPVVDLELIGNCDPPPDKATLQAQVEAFIEQVETSTDQQVIVYFHPDFETHYAMVDDLDRRLWVRRVGPRQPPGDWTIWQRDDAGSVAGVRTPVDIDVMRR